jgi:hypothetical protein
MKEGSRGEKLMNKKRLIVIIVIVVAAVLVAILFDTMLANNEPVITSLTVEPEGIPPLGSCRITCNASDRDGDALSYNWSASGGSISGTSAAVNWTAPNSEGFYDVTITVTDGRGCEATDHRTIEVRANRPPTISSLIVDAYWTLPSGTFHMACTASDPDGDELSYEWTVDGGEVYGMGAAVNWTAPEAPGAYNVTVVVKDGYGGEDMANLPLSVDLATPPVIENLAVTPKGHIYLRECTVAGCDYDVWKTREYDIECIASGTGELVYDWSCTDGQIAGEGSTIIWTAPSKTLIKATVTVVVSDAAGNTIGKNIVFHVPSCTCGSW